jgi:AcrR family transcriptional regulator
LKDPEERRKELIDAAEHLFKAVGYDQTAISDIVKEVNVSQGAFYYYFDSKEAVLVAVAEKQISLMEGDLGQIANRVDLDGVILLNSMINRFISIMASGKKITGYIQEEKKSALHKKLMKIRPFGRIAPIMAAVISRWIDKGRFDVAYPLKTSYLLLMLLASSLRMMSIAGTEGIGVEHSQRMRAALEELLGRALGVTDYKFRLQI